MLFSSATFLFAFLPVVALLYYLIPKRCTAARNLFLTGASLLFYAWGEPRFVLVMLLVIVSSWLFACKIEASAKSARKGFLLVAVSVDLTVLFVFKYLGFFTENLNRLPFVRLPVPQIHCQSAFPSLRFRQFPMWSMCTVGKRHRKACGMSCCTLLSSRN